MAGSGARAVCDVSAADEVVEFTALRFSVSLFFLCADVFYVLDMGFELTRPSFTE